MASDKKPYWLLPPSTKGSRLWILYEVDSPATTMKFLMHASTKSELLLKCAVNGISEDEIEELDIQML